MARVAKLEAEVAELRGRSKLKYGSRCRKCGAAMVVDKVMGEVCIPCFNGPRPMPAVSQERLESVPGNARQCEQCENRARREDCGWTGCLVIESDFMKDHLKDGVCVKRKPK